MKGFVWSRMGSLAFRWSAAVWLAALAGPLFAQAPTISSVRVTTTPAGRTYYVDGQFYNTPRVFLWPAGSKHTLSTDPVQLDIRDSVRWSFGGWSSNLGSVLTDGSGNVQITVDPKLTELTATFSEQFEVFVSFYDCPPGTPQDQPCPGTPGVVTAGATFNFSGKTYLSAGTYNVTARANPGWVFVGFFASPNQSAPFIGSINVTGPMGIYAKFALARQIRVESTPPGLQIYADRSPVNTPFTIEWGRGSLHTLDAPEAQDDLHGGIWIFDSWSSGAPRQHSYTVPEGGSPLAFSAKFIRGERVTVLTEPAGLPLVIDGRSNLPEWTFRWAVGSQHAIAAPLRQVDSKGRVLTFKGWAHGGDASQTVTIADTGGLGSRYVALYDSKGPLTIQSNIPELRVNVDGTECATPCKLEPEVGQTLSMTVPQTLPVSDGSRYYFSGWDPGAIAATQRTVTIGQEPILVTATYRLQHRLTAFSDPADGSRITLSPQPDQGFYNAETPVKVTAEANTGFRFQFWDGDASGSSRTVDVDMFGPRTVRAVLAKVPTISKGGVRNAADGTLEGGVAAGSAISIFGASLAGSDITGPSNPLAQTLGDVTVLVGSRILPLYFVSSGQINAQLPPDLPEGNQSLIVRWEGKPDTTADFTVVRNAPGIFQNLIDGQNYGLILNSNGVPVTPTTPVRKGETVTILASGLGPFLTTPLEGFGVPAEGPNYRTADPTDVLVGSDVVAPIYAGAAEGRPGITAVRFRVADTTPTGNAQIRVRCGGRTSNTVLLPVQ